MRIIIAVAIVGFLYSIFLGIFASGIFSFEGREPDYNDETRPGWSWRVFQFWLSFSCCAVGWALGLCFLQRILNCPSQFSFKVDDAIPLRVTLLGITELLPRTLFLGKVPWKT